MADMTAQTPPVEPIAHAADSPSLRDAELKQIAGTGAFARGREYAQAGRISLDACSADGLRGHALGTRRYALRLQRENGQWQWDCECPAADDGSFCKHLVAAVIAARAAASEAGACASARDAEDRDRMVQALGHRLAEIEVLHARGDVIGLHAQGQQLGTLLASMSAARTPRPPRAQAPLAKSDLAAFLQAQPASRLAAWLMDLAADDAAIEKRLRLQLAADDPSQLKSALGKLLDAGGFLDYHGCLRYARRLDGLLGVLRRRLTESPAHALELAAYALARLFRIYANSDDSSGALGERLAEVVEVLRDACAAATPPADWAKTFHKLHAEDGWDLLALPDFWPLLGAQGQAVYAKRVADAFASLPPASEDSRYERNVFIACRMAESYARVSGDFELLQRVLRRDLRHAVDHLRVLDSLRGAGRAREAQEWAEAAVRKFPRDASLRAALSACLRDAGLDEEALQQSWQAFQLRPASASWDTLKQCAGDAWPQWRERALAHCAAPAQGTASLRITLLMHDGDLAAALEFATENAVMAGTLIELARALQSTQPQAAGALLLRVVDAELPRADAGRYAGLISLMQRATRLLPPSSWQPHLDTIKSTYARRPKLMALMREAGL